MSNTHPNTTHIVLNRETLLRPLQLVAGVIEKRQIHPILANVELNLNSDQKLLTITGSDTEIELVGKIDLTKTETVTITNFNPITLPGRKLIDICRTLPENSTIEIAYDTSSGRATVTSERSRFILATLPASDFPLIPEQKSIVEFTVKRKILYKLASRTCFAIPQQEVRSYLNGMFLEIKEGVIKTIASDLFRFALNAVTFSATNKTFAQVIIPRKTVMELIRLLAEEAIEDAEITVGLNSNYIKIHDDTFTFTSKLIACKLPNYNNIINSLLPKKGNKNITVNRNALKQALHRINILSHEILRTFRLILEDGVLRLIANNPEQEEAVEELFIDYHGENIETLLNINYLLDIINNLEHDQVVMTLKDGGSGIVVESTDDDSNSLYLLMPIRKK